MSKVRFTAIYDWLAEIADLNSNEKIIIAHVLRFHPAGCYKSNNRLAKDLGIDRSTVIRTLKGLIDKEWIAPLYETRRDRILYVSEVKRNNMPLFDAISGSGNLPPPVGGKLHQGSGKLHQVGGNLPPTGSGNLPPCVNRNSTDLSYSEKRREKRVLNEVNFLASSMKEKTGRPNAEQFERRRQQLRRQVENL